MVRLPHDARRQDPDVLVSGQNEDGLRLGAGAELDPVARDGIADDAEDLCAGDRVRHDPRRAARPRVAVAAETGALGGDGLRGLHPRHAAPDPDLPRLLRAAGGRHQPAGVLGRRDRAVAERRGLHRRDRARGRRLDRDRTGRGRALDRHAARADPVSRPAAAVPARGGAAYHQRADHAREGLGAAIGDLGLRADARRPGDHRGALRAARGARAGRAPARARRARRRGPLAWLSRWLERGLPVW